MSTTPFMVGKGRWGEYVPDLDRSLERNRGPFFGRYQVSWRGMSSMVGRCYECGHHSLSFSWGPGPRYWGRFLFRAFFVGPLEFRRWNRKPDPNVKPDGGGCKQAWHTSDGELIWSPR